MEYINDLKNLRKMKGYTLSRVSRETGLSIPLLCKLERHQVKITKNSAEILSSYYGVEIKQTFVHSVETENDYKLIISQKDKMIKILQCQLESEKNSSIAEIYKLQKKLDNIQKILNS